MINRFFRQGYHHEQMTVHAQSIAKREFLYAKDAAKAVMVGLNQKELSGAFNIGSTEYLTNEEIAKIICSAMSPEMEVMLGSETETIESSYMDSSKMMNTFMEELEWSIASSCLTQTCKFFLLIIADNGKSSDSSLRLGHHPFSNSNNTFC